MIGFAFDSPAQVDYQYFFKDKELSDEKKAELLKNMELVFDKCFFCAIDKKLKRIVLNLFGCGAFSWLFPGGSTSFSQEIYFPAFENSLQRWNEKLTTGEVKEISLMGCDNDSDWNKFESIMKKFNRFACVQYNRIPNVFRDGPLSNEEEIQKTLFTNAWDSHSVAGNGNGLDRSLDGFWGRISGISVLCDPKINLAFTKEKVKFLSP